MIDPGSKIQTSEMAHFDSVTRAIARTITITLKLHKKGRDIHFI